MKHLGWIIPIILFALGSFASAFSYNANRIDVIEAKCNTRIEKASESMQNSINEVKSDIAEVKVDIRNMQREIIQTIRDKK